MESANKIPASVREHLIEVMNMTLIAMERAMLACITVAGAQLDLRPGSIFYRWKVAGPFT